MRPAACILLFAVIISGPSLAQARACLQRPVTIMEIDRGGSGNDPEIKVDGKNVKRGGELEALRNSCGDRLAVIFYSHATMCDLIDSQFFSSKSGFHEMNGNYFAFAVNLGKSRMIYLRTMTEVDFTVDPDALATFVKKPPVTNQYSR